MAVRYKPAGTHIEGLFTGPVSSSQHVASSNWVISEWGIGNLEKREDLTPVCLSIINSC